METVAETKCGRCGTEIQFNPNDAGKPATCPSCTNQILLPQVESEQSFLKKSPKLRIANIRENTCYPFFRGAINVLAFLMLMGSVGAVLCFIMGGIMFNQAPDRLGLIGCICFETLTIALTLALREGAFVLVDIADMMAQRD